MQRSGSRTTIRSRSLSRQLQRFLRNRRIDADIKREERALEGLEIDDRTKALGLIRLRREYERGDDY